MSELICFGAILLAMLLQADGDLSCEPLRLSFISFRSVNLSEVRCCLIIHGKEDNQCKTRLRVRFNSVGTDLPLCDGHICKQLFETRRSVEVEITTRLDLELIAELAGDAQLEICQLSTADQHKLRRVCYGDLLATHLDGNCFPVVILPRLILNVADFDLATGVESLLELAMLISILR